MKKVKADLKTCGVYFFKNLPSYNQVLNVFTSKTTESFASHSAKQFASKAHSKAHSKKHSKDHSKKHSKAHSKKHSKDHSKNNHLFPMLICDQKLQRRQEIKLWLKNRLVYSVSAGEHLKSLQNFPDHINRILKKSKNKKISGFISLGGGSVGDFTGFLASVYQRGQPLVHIPTTWLSALDSAHGGKTALNAGPFKNMLGSYCFPRAVFIVKDLLSSLPNKEKESAQGELIKIALIEGGSFYKTWLKKHKGYFNMWDFLPQAILAKLKIIEKDPYEKTGLRARLNLGHTLGHVLEPYFGLRHGEAIMYGLIFALRWSYNRFGVSRSFLEEMSFLMNKQNQLDFYLKKIPDNTLKKILLQDKKRVEKEHIQFIFLKKPGLVFSEKVSAKDIIQEIKRQLSKKK